MFQSVMTKKNQWSPFYIQEAYMKHELSIRQFICILSCPNILSVSFLQQREKTNVRYEITAQKNYLRKIKRERGR
jgi:predicted metal-binding protein